MRGKLRLLIKAVAVSLLIPFLSLLMSAYHYFTSLLVVGFIHVTDDFFYPNLVKHAQESNEFFVITLFGAAGGLIKHLTERDDRGFLSHRIDLPWIKIKKSQIKDGWFCSPRMSLQLEVAGDIIYGKLAAIAVIALSPPGFRSNNPGMLALLGLLGGAFSDHLLLLLKEQIFSRLMSIEIKEPTNKK